VVALGLRVAEVTRFDLMRAAAADAAVAVAVEAAGVAGTSVAAGCDRRALRRTGGAVAVLRARFIAIFTSLASARYSAAWLLPDACSAPPAALETAAAVLLAKVANH
jgi:hypothetical protein